MKLKSLYLILMLTICSALMAQEKYEQAIVRQANGAEIQISIEGKEFRLNKIRPMIIPQDYSPILKEIGEMRENGWEIWNSTSDGTTISYFLRRKLK